jgi:hypothetical protein
MENPMGWTFMPSRSRNRLEMIRPLLNYENDSYTQQIIDHALTGTTVYLLAERKPKGPWEPDHTYINDPDGTFRWIAVFQTRRDRGEFDFGYKDQCESMGPCQTACPTRLIDHASPLRHPDPDHERNWAAQWRRDCLRHRAAKSARRKTKLAHGTSIRLSHVIEFSDGYTGDLFTAHVVQRRGRNQTYFKSPCGGLYRIKNLHDIGFQVEASHA